MDQIRNTLHDMGDDRLDSADCRNHRGEDPVDRSRSNNQVGVGLVVGAEPMAHHAVVVERMKRVAMVVCLDFSRVNAAIAQLAEQLKERPKFDDFREMSMAVGKIQDSFSEEQYIDWRGLSHCVHGRISKPYQRIYKPPIRFRRGLINPPPLG